MQRRRSTTNSHERTISQRKISNWNNPNQNIVLFGDLIGIKVTILLLFHHISYKFHSASPAPACDLITHDNDMMTKTVVTSALL